MQNSYLRLEPEPGKGTRHPLLLGLEDAPRIVNAVRRVEVAATLDDPSGRTETITATAIPRSSSAARSRSTWSGSAGGATIA